MTQPEMSLQLQILRSCLNWNDLGYFMSSHFVSDRSPSSTLYWTLSDQYEACYEYFSQEKDIISPSANWISFTAHPNSGDL